MQAKPFHIVQWDYRQQPDWEEVGRAVGSYQYAVIMVIESTGQDQFAILVSGEYFTPEESRAAYEYWCSLQQGISGE